MGALTRTIDGLQRLASWRTAGSAVVVLVLVNLAMKGWLLPDIAARRPEAVDDGFLVMIDLEPLRSSAEVYRVFDLYTPDILGAVRMLYALDFVIPLAFACVLSTLIGKLLRSLGLTAGGWRACVLLPFVAMLFDDIENVLVLVLLGQYQDGVMSPALARAAGIVTLGKFVGLGLTALVLLVLLLRAAVRRFVSRVG